MYSSDDRLVEVVCPEIVYCARFGAEVQALHFHLFPRTASMAKEYLAEAVKGAGLNGPVLLNWARERYASVTATAAQRARVKEVTHAIREYVRAVQHRNDRGTKR